MNIQAMMKQAQQIQKELMKAKDEIDNTIYTGESNFVKVELYGTKKISKIEIDKTKITDLEDLEILEDMITVSFNEALDKIDKDTEQKLGKYTQGMPGLF